MQVLLAAQLLCLEIKSNKDDAPKHLEYLVDHGILEEEQEQNQEATGEQEEEEIEWEKALKHLSDGLLEAHGIGEADIFKALGGDVLHVRAHNDKIPLLQLWSAFIVEVCLVYFIYVWRPLSLTLVAPLFSHAQIVFRFCIMNQHLSFFLSIFVEQKKTKTILAD